MSDTPEQAFTAFNLPDPYPYYAQLREQKPLHRAQLPNGQSVWIVTRQDEILAVVKDPRFGKDMRRRKKGGQTMRRVLAQPAFNRIANSMLRADPPDHTRLRALVTKAFTPRRIEQLAPRIQAIADELLDAVAARHEMDLIAAYAFPLPVIVIGEMLGIPVADHERLKAWSQVLIEVSAETAFGVDTSLKGLLTLAGRFVLPRKNKAGLLRSLREFVAYLEHLIEERRARPQDDLVSALIAAEEQSDKLSKEELVSMVTLLLVAGHETTVNLIGNGMLALLTHPEQLAKLRADPTLAKGAIEEFLRYNGPVLAVPRFAFEDVEVAGQLIRRDESLMLLLASANHDPAYTAEGEGLDILRVAGQHLAFSSGIHYCVGAPLARLEGQIAFNTLLRRCPQIELAVAPEALQWHLGRLLHGLVALPVKF